MNKSKELVIKVHAGNILGFLQAVTGRLSEKDFANAELIVSDYIERYFSDSENVSGKGIT